MTTCTKTVKRIVCHKPLLVTMVIMTIVLSTNMIVE